MKMNLPTTPAGETASITKPADWSNHMVTAALEFASDEKTPTSYTNTDEARIDILNTLNWYEAHREYIWPNFTQSGFDFAQNMRLRRALVSDVCAALQKAGNVRIDGQPGGLGTLESEGRVRGGKRNGNADSRRMEARKRHCKRENGCSIAVDSEGEHKSFLEDEELLSGTMKRMIATSRVDVDGYLNGEKDSKALEAIVHDGLVQVWDRPVAEYETVPQELERKHEAWAEFKRSIPPRSTQREKNVSMPAGGIELFRERRMELEDLAR